MVKVLESERDARRKANETRPILSDEITEDLRFGLGYVAALNWVLSLQSAAAKEITGITQEKKP